MCNTECKQNSTEYLFNSSFHVFPLVDFFLHSYHLSSQIHIPFPLFVFLVSSNSCRVRQVPRGASQSCRDGPQPTVAPQWRAGRGAGNPKPQEARQAGGRFVRHVDLSPLTSNPQPKTLPAEQHHPRTDWPDTKTHPPPALIAPSQHYSVTLQRFVHAVLCLKKKEKKRESFMFSVNFLLDKRENPTNGLFCYATGRWISPTWWPVSETMRPPACSLFFMCKEISLSLLWTAELHVAANPDNTM